MNWIQESIESNLKKPVFGSFWYTLLISYILLNWQILFILFFEDSGKFPGLKVTYICKEYFGAVNLWLNCNIITGIMSNPWLVINILWPWLLAGFSIWLVPLLENFILSQKLPFFEKQEKVLDDSGIKSRSAKRDRAIIIMEAENRKRIKEQEKYFEDSLEHYKAE